MKFHRDFSVDESGCIFVCSFAAKVDYQSANFEGERWLVHRLSYHLNVAPISRKPGSRKDNMVLHTCDIKRCINPDHLYLGSAKQNVKDTFERHPTVREKISKAHKGKRAGVKFGKDWTGLKLPEETKKRISERAKSRYSEMTKEQRRNHMMPAFSSRWKS